jgi:protein-L-isoaspartate(D-aspartate) O-methyltransferase
MNLLKVVILFLIIPLSQASLIGQNYEQLRKAMVQDQIRKRGISSSKVLDAMGRVPRHLYVPANVQAWAYDDRPLPIGYGQTISQPYMVAYMTDIVAPEKNFRVLEIGTGSGYQAAVLAELVEHVFTIEIVEPLGKTAGEVLLSQYDNVSVRIGDGYQGWPEEAPFDAIIVTAAPEKIPPRLEEQLKEGGRIVIPVGAQGKVQHLMLGQKRKGKIEYKKMMPVRFVPFTTSPD